MRAKRERITHTEAHDLGLKHVRPSDHVTASPNRRSVVVDTPGGATGFTKTKEGWKAHLYDDQMAGHLQRRRPSEAVPYEQYLQDTRQSVFHDRR